MKKVLLSLVTLLVLFTACACGSPSGTYVYDSFTLSGAEYDSMSEGAQEIAVAKFKKLMEGYEMTFDKKNVTVKMGEGEGAFQTSAYKMDGNKIVILDEDGNETDMAGSSCEKKGSLLVVKMSQSGLNIELILKKK